MKPLRLVAIIAFALVATLLPAEDISSEQIQKRFAFDQEETIAGAHVYLKNGKVTGLEPTGIPVIEKAVVPLPPRSKVTRIYYGYAPDGRTPESFLVMWEFDPAEVTLFYEIVSDFSFHYRAPTQLFRVTEAGKLEAEGVHVSRLVGHLCSLGFYLFSDDGRVTYIDGHPDTEDFTIEKPQFFVFRNPTLNAVLEAKLNQLKKNKVLVPTSSSVTPAASTPAPVEPAR
jgi:hypothetical protein